MFDLSFSDRFYHQGNFSKRCSSLRSKTSNKECHIFCVADGWRAFLAAHTNMNKIQMSMELIPGHVRTTLRILVRGSSSIIADLLPSEIGWIRKIGSDCVKLANNTHQAFVNVMGLLGEVISMTEVARGVQYTRWRQTEIDLNVSRVMQDKLNHLGESIKTYFNDARDAVRTAQAEYSRALNAIPTGFKALLLDLGRAIVGIISIFGKSTAKGQTGGTGSTVPAALTNGQSLAFARLLSDTLGQLSGAFNKFLSSMNNSTNSSSSKNPMEEFQAFKTTFGAYLNSINAGGQSDLKTNVSNLIQKSIQLCNDILDLVKKSLGSGNSIEPSVSNPIENRLSALINEVKPLMGAEIMNGGNTPPSTNSGTGNSISSDSSSNERFVAQMAKERLQEAEKRYDTAFAELKQHQEEIGKLMAKIARLDLERINYVEILELLREALRLLAQVREQWNQLVLFFAEIAVRAEVALSGTLEPFMERATLAGNARLSNDDRLFYVDLLKTQAVEIHKQSYSLFIMSRTYVDMSNEFMMKRLAGLGKMLTANDNAERSRMLQELNDETQVAQEKIAELVNQRKATYTAAINKRRQELDAFVAALGGPQTGDVQAINGAKDILGLN